MKNILIIEDSLNYQIMLEEILRADFQITLAGSVEEAQIILRNEKSLDLILLDIILPDGSGMDFFLTIKENPALKNTPVIFLSAKDEIDTKVLGLTLGAEDYITKPFHPRELLARVKNKVLVRGNKEEDKLLIRHDGLTLNLATFEANIKSQEGEGPVDLTPMEFKILSFLAGKKGRVYSRNQIIDNIWGNQVAITDRNIDVHICKIRKKIVNSGHNILNKKGVGYCFN